MRLIRRLNDWPTAAADARSTVATIGNFDGVHLGHQAILQQVRQVAERFSVPATVITFDPLPHEYFAGSSAPARLQGLRDKTAAIASAGIDRVLLLRFNQQFASQPAMNFIEQALVDRLRIKHLVIGDDFRFGHERRGDFTMLEAAAKQFGFGIERTVTVSDQSGLRISSTRTREALQTSDLTLAERLLGRPYRISGRVVHGAKVGRQLGFPTANVALKGHVPPLRGVFAVHATIAGSSTAHPAVANLGERPTVGGRKLLLEVHLLDGQFDLYNSHLAVDFLHAIRDEKPFPSLDALKAQIAEDAAIARNLLT